MDCNPDPRVIYREFSAGLHNRAGSGKSLPLNGTLEMTTRCNLRCVHCYVPLSCRAGTRGSLVTGASQDRSPLSYEECCHLLDEIADEGCLWLLLSGGEPLLRPDFLDIFVYAKRKGLLITLFTNATLVTERIADCLREYRPFKVEVTLYGATSTTYEAITGVPGSFRRCQHGIELLADRGLPLLLKTMALKANRHEMTLTEQLARQMGLPFRWDHRVTSQLDGGVDPVDSRLTPEEMVQLELAHPDRVKAWRDFIPAARHVSLGDRLFGCNAGDGNFHVDAFGYLQLCGFVRRHSYDLRQGPFRDGYYTYFPQVRGLRRPTDTPCDRCGLVRVCDVCPAWWDLEGDGQNGPVDYVHSFARLLANAIGFDADGVATAPG